MTKQYQFTIYARQLLADMFPFGKFSIVAVFFFTHGNSNQGCRTSEGQGGGGSFFKGHFQYCTYRHYHQHWRHTVKQLSTSPKPE